MAMTYASLKADVTAYVERGTATNDPIFASQLPSLINITEKKISRELKIQGFLKSVVSTMQVGVAVYPKPDRWRETQTINFGVGTGNNTRTPLLFRSYEYLRWFWPDQTATAVPQFWGDYDYGHFIISPTPDVAYPFEVTYFEMPEELSDSVQTNWITEYAPQLLLYGTLIEASSFLKSDERLPLWQSQYDRAAQALSGEDTRKFNGQPL
jgi:hypothetical protein